MKNDNNDGLWFSISVFLWSIILLVFSIQFSIVIQSFLPTQSVKVEYENVSMGKNVEDNYEECVVEKIAETPTLESLGIFKLTAYCSCEKCCGEWAHKRPLDKNEETIVYGASGMVLVAGESVAVDPSIIPYGSEIEINGNRYIAHDCGGAIKGNRIDVYFNSHKEALEFGVKNEEVFLIKK